MDGIQGWEGPVKRVDCGVRKVVRVTLIIVLVVLSGCVSNMSYYATGQAMTGYPVFLLYFCNGIYGVGYFLILVITLACTTKLRKFKNAGGGPSDTNSPLMGSYEGAESTYGGSSGNGSSELWGNMWEQKFFVAIGLCTGLALEMEQFANGKVNGDLQVVLLQLTMPATAICSRLYLKTNLSLWNWAGGLFVFVGIFLVAKPWGKSAGDASVGGVWALIYGLSTIPLGMACVMQEKLFETCSNISVLKVTAWSTLWGVVFNLLTIPVSMLPGLVLDTNGEAVYPHGASFSQLISHQVDSLRCFFGDFTMDDGSTSGLAADLGATTTTMATGEIPPGCEDHAARIVMVYVVSYGINVYCYMALIKEMKAVFTVVFAAMVVPLSTIGYSVAPIVKLLKAGVPEPLTFHVVCGSAICMLGLLVFKGDLFAKRTHTLSRSLSDVSSMFGREFVRSRARSKR